ncbi:hypothetical protein K7432_009045 [Basidiobolus ranarum]|uniref:Carrier domain-containing protein n=1 Tax=Basidiobolus ranarum TaxID=34480 RepID=A0ABR2VYG5_9FUNG
MLSKQLISPFHAEMLSGNFKSLFEGLVSATTDTKLKHLSLDLNLELADFGSSLKSSTSAGVTNSCLHHIFESQANLHPNNIAVQFETSEYVTYGELNRRANRLAHRLIELGVRPESMVPLCLDKSVSTIVAILAVLKAGGAYVPLDPNNPVERNLFILEETKAQVVVTIDHYKEPFDKQRLILLDVDDGIIQQQREHNPQVNRLTSSNLCYILYTSGSTGTPKGVMMEHSAVISFTQALRGVWNLTNDDLVLQFANYTFDSSVLEIFGTLTSGACIALAPKEALLSNLAQTIDKMNVTSLVLTTTIATYIDPSKVPSVKRLMFGGEMITTTVRDSWLPYVELINGYGPTEATVAILMHPQLDEKTTCSNVGKPIGSNRIHILGLDMHPVPVGVVGELCVSGPQLARGYLNRPDLTEKVFVLNPSDINERLYRTGDLAHYNSDGSVELIGRKDNQIKLNGLRIELDEIEHALSDHSKVGRACVLPLITDTRTNHKVLVAFLTFKNLTYGDHEARVLHGENSKIAAVYIEQVRNLVRNKLPSHMIPSLWLPLNKMPLNSSDKIDKKVLALLFEQLDSQLLQVLKSPDDLDIIQPRTEDEKLIQEIWSEVLNISRNTISINHYFRQLGGDSILAIQVSSICRRRNLHVSVHSMLQNLTLSQLAELVSVKGTQILKNVERIEGTLHLSPNQRKVFESVQDNLNHLNQSYLLRIREPIKLDILSKSIQQLTSMHDILRSRFTRSGKEWKLRVLPPEGFSFEVHHCLIQSVEELKSHIYTLQNSHDLVSGPLFQFALYELSEGQQLIFVTIHRLIIDQLSWEVIWSDLESLVQGKECSHQSISYMQWNQALYDHAQTLDMSSWPRQQSTQPLITDIDLLAKNTHETTCLLSFTLDSHFAKLARKYCDQSAGVELVDLLISSLAYSYCCTFERESLSVTLESLGRQFKDRSVDISRTVGWFTNFYPVVVGIAKGASMIDTIFQTVSQQHQIRGNEASYGLLSYLNEKTASLFGKDPAQVTLYYKPNSLNIDSASSFFLPITTDSKYKFDLGGTSPKWIRPQVFNCEARFVGEELEATIAYSNALHSELQIQQWLDSWETSLIDGIMSISKGALFELEGSLPLYTSHVNNIVENDGLTLISKSSKETMFIVHCATGMASYFSLLRKYMRSTLYSISDPTLGTNESFDSIEMFAMRYLTAIRRVQPKGPYYLNGYSFGGLIAFEMARQLEAQGHEVARVTVIDTMAPNTLPPNTGGQLETCSDSQKYLDLISTLGQWNLNEAASQMILEKIEKNSQLMREYQPPKKKLSTRIVLVKAGASQDPHACYGWSEYADSVVTHHVDAEHHQLMFEPNVSKIAQYLQ